MNLLRHLIRGVLHAAGNDGAQSGGGGGDSSAANNNAGGDAGAADAGRAEVEQRARDMGWAPKEEWRGNPAAWIDAGEYVQRGEQMIPILRSNLRKTETELATLRSRSQKQERDLAAALESIDVLTNLSTEQSRNAAKEKRRELLRQQAEARREGNVDLEIDIGEQIAEVTSQIKDLDAEPQQQQQQQQRPGTGKGGKQAGGQQQQQAPEQNPEQSPDYVAWTQDNPWFGKDRRKTALATEIGAELRADPANAHLQGRAFFDRVTQELNKYLGLQARGPSKVESGGGASHNGGGGGGGDRDPVSGKTYADLPQDAKEACERNIKYVVGEGRAFKDANAWRKHYVSAYFNS